MSKYRIIQLYEKENAYLQKTQYKTARKGEFKRTSNMKSIKKSRHEEAQLCPLRRHYELTPQF